MMQGLADKRVLITGGARGIGASTAARFVAVAVAVGSDAIAPREGAAKVSVSVVIVVILR